eukprot:scaffold616279_cov11-Prasinocladus_malaysianus.AAC.1
MALSGCVPSAAPLTGVPFLDVEDNVFAGATVPLALLLSRLDIFRHRETGPKTSGRLSVPYLRANILH